MQRWQRGLQACRISPVAALCVPGFAHDADVVDAVGRVFFVGSFTEPGLGRVRAGDLGMGLLSLVP